MVVPERAGPAWQTLFEGYEFFARVPLGLLIKAQFPWLRVLRGPCYKSRRSLPMHTFEEWHWYQSVTSTEPRPHVAYRPPEEPLLEAWDNRLAAQNVYFDMCLARRNAHAPIADEKNVAFLRTDQGLAKPRIEKAVATFIREGSWPALTHREHLHLIVRIQLARKIVSAIREGTPQGMVVKSQMPDLGNREQTIQWFLVDLWNLAGKAFLAAMARDFPEKRTEPRTDTGQVEELAGEPTT